MIECEDAAFDKKVNLCQIDIRNVNSEVAKCVRIKHIIIPHITTVDK